MHPISSIIDYFDRKLDEEIKEGIIEIGLLKLMLKASIMLVFGPRLPIIEDRTANHGSVFEF